MRKISYAGYRFPPEIIRQAIWLYLRFLDEAIARLDRIIAKLAQKDETARRLMSIPGFGPITASAMAATIQDTSSFAGPREFAAFLGLTPKQNSSGGKPKQRIWPATLVEARRMASARRALPIVEFIEG
jgi:transposase